MITRQKAYGARRLSSSGLDPEDGACELALNSAELEPIDVDSGITVGVGQVSRTCSHNERLRLTLQARGGEVPLGAKTRPSDGVGDEVLLSVIAIDKVPGLSLQDTPRLLFYSGLYQTAVLYDKSRVENPLKIRGHARSFASRSLPRLRRSARSIP